MKNSLIITAFLILTSFSISQTQISSEWTEINMSNSGLPSNSVQVIKQDPSGNYWIGCSTVIMPGDDIPGGLVKYDGSTWTVYNSVNSPLVSDNVVDLDIDVNGSVWIANENALLKFTGSDWTVYDSSNSPLPYGSTYSILIDAQNRKWVGAKNYSPAPNSELGVYMYNDTSWSSFNEANSCDLIYDLDYLSENPDGYIFVIKDFGGLCYLSEGSWFSPDKFSVQAVTGHTYYDCRDWFTGWNAEGWFVFYRDDTSWYAFDTTDLGVNAMMSYRTITADSNGVVYAGCREGLLHYNGTEWALMNSSNTVMPYNWLSYGMTDNANNKWFAAGNDAGGYSPRGILIYNESGVDITSVDEKAYSVPVEYKLYNNYPNPFNPVTVITFQIPENEIVVIKVYDVLGREVKTILNEYRSAGKYETVFDAGGLASGIYYYTLETQSYFSVKKMLLLK